VVDKTLRAVLVAGARRFTGTGEVSRGWCFIAGPEARRFTLRYTGSAGDVGDAAILSVIGQSYCGSKSLVDLTPGLPGRQRQKLYGSSRIAALPRCAENWG
jgi:hypothetical protein